MFLSLFHSFYRKKRGRSSSPPLFLWGQRPHQPASWAALRKHFFSSLLGQPLSLSSQLGAGRGGCSWLSLSSLSLPPNRSLKLWLLTEELWRSLLDNCGFWRRRCGPWLSNCGTVAVQKHRSKLSSLFFFDLQFHCVAIRYSVQQWIYSILLYSSYRLLLFIHFYNLNLAA